MFASAKAANESRDAEGSVPPPKKIKSTSCTSALSEDLFAVSKYHFVVNPVVTELSAVSDVV